MSELDASIESSRLSSRPGNRPRETETDRRGPAPEDDRGAAMRAKALEILRREYGPGKVAQASPPAGDGGVPAAGAASAPGGSENSQTGVSAPPEQSAPAKSAFAEAIPARMLNEFVYCPRLFFYEFVEGVFVENADTVRGKNLHRRVDTDGGGLPPAKSGKSEVRGPKSEVGPEARAGSKEQGELVQVPGESPDTAREARAVPEPEVIHSRSVQMGSKRLGVTAKMDLVEVRTGGDGLFGGLEVCPVDYKAGAPKDGEDGNELWDADRMQLGLQALILRENDYACSEGIIYYRATKQRVRLAITPELEAWIVEQVGAARCAAVGAIPSPLVDSPKCPRCSLVTVCLPDETRLLAEAAEGKTEAASPRRLIAARDDARALYLNKPGLRVGRKEELLQIKEERSLLDEVRINDVSHVALFGNIQISTQAIQTLCEAEVPVTYFSMGGWFYGLTRGHELKNVFLRIEQFRQAQDPAACLRLARQFVHGKIRNHRTMLMRNHLEPPPATLGKLKQSADAALRAAAMDELLGIEGGAAAAYFGQFTGMIKVADDMPEGAEGEPANPTQLVFNFNFTNRNRRPPTDPVNAMLSLAYSLLSKDCTLALLAVGFDPYVGFFHQPRFGRPALALDLMEEFRALVAESTVLSCINNRAITEADFVRAGQAVNLTAAGRRRFFEMYEQRMTSVLTHPVFDYKVSYRRALELQARLLAKVLTGEIPEYVPLMTR